MFEEKEKLLNDVVKAMGMPSLELAPESVKNTIRRLFETGLIFGSLAMLNRHANQLGHEQVMDSIKELDKVFGTKALEILMNLSDSNHEDAEKNESGDINEVASYRCLVLSLKKPPSVNLNTVLLTLFEPVLVDFTETIFLLDRWPDTVAPTDFKALLDQQHLTYTIGAVFDDHVITTDKGEYRATKDGFVRVGLAA